MDLGLNNKRALVIASSKGLGRGIAETLAAEGAELLLCGRDEAALQDAAKGIIDRGGRAKWTACDLSAPDFANTMTAKAKAELGGVDILVNNTGGPPPRHGAIYHVGSNCNARPYHGWERDWPDKPATARYDCGRLGSRSDTDLLRRRTAHSQFGTFKHIACRFGWLEQDTRC